ncbi:heme-binding protein [Hyphomicrobiales bacterium]|nr:heme-binding protein [Hyphomicrobiales bacterium]
MNRILSFFVIILVSINLNAEITTKPVLTLDIASKMANSCINLAKKSGWKVNIAIYESPGSLKYYSSMDGTYPASEEISRLKGKTSAGLPYSTAELRDMAFEGDSANNGILTLPGVILIKGGVPIILDDGYHIGGVGVSGDSGGNDENCAKIAADVAKKLMVK